MLSFDSVCRCVSARRTTPSVCRDAPNIHSPSTNTHTHTHSRKIYIFFNFQPEGRYRNKHKPSPARSDFVFMCCHVLCQSCKCARVYVYNPHISVYVCPPPTGAQHPSGHGLRRGPSPLRCLPGSPAAVQGLEACVEHPGHQHRRVPAPQTCPLPQGLHPQ